MGVTFYRVERCEGAGCANFVQIGTSPTSGFTDSGVTASTTYNYRVRAVDSAGNLSGYSNTAGVTTPASTDTQSPTPPLGLSVTATSSSQVTLAWTASTDNVGVTGYLVERCQGVGLRDVRADWDVVTSTYATTGRPRRRATATACVPHDAANNLSTYLEHRRARRRRRHRIRRRPGASGLVAPPHVEQSDQR